VNTPLVITMSSAHYRNLCDYAQKTHGVSMEEMKQRNPAELFKTIAIFWVESTKLAGGPVKHRQQGVVVSRSDLDGDAPLNAFLRTLKVDMDVQQVTLVLEVQASLKELILSLGTAPTAREVFRLVVEPPSLAG